MHRHMAESLRGRVQAASFGRPRPRCTDGGGSGHWSVVGSELDEALEPEVEKRTRLQGPDPQALSCLVGHSCLKGRKRPGRQQLPNQDSWAAHHLPGKGTALGVFDGHGESGHVVSDAAQERLTRDVAMAALSGSKGRSGRVEGLYERAQQSIAEQPQLGGQRSGTSATIVVHNVADHTLVVSHVGDSSAVVVRRKAACDGEIEGIFLTRDHKPDLEDERDRIQKSGGRVLYDGHGYRVCGAGMALNMSRSLGDVDLHSASGVVAKPEVTEYPLSWRDRALVVCSDGIWEFVKPQEIAEILEKFDESQAMTAAQHIADTAASRWRRSTGGEMMDDITVLVMFLCAEDVSAVSTTDDSGSDVASVPSVPSVPSS
mmetsp:Transcript_117366/g.374023  ORF Transcript_117366/g.374023 Transcript_117366/m.374023 type:complete len:373 (+) Transcript_117366:97-1215(+)